MRRLLAAGALVAAVAGVMPAHASGVPAPGGTCDGKVDVACRQGGCVPDYPCTITICLVWTNGACGIHP